MVSEFALLRRLVECLNKRQLRAGNSLVQQAHEQQQRRCQRERRMTQRKPNATGLNRKRDTSSQQRQVEVANPFAEETDRRDQVIEFIEQLNQTFHSNALANDGQQRSARFRLTRIQIRVGERIDIRLLRVRYSAVK